MPGPGARPPSAPAPAYGGMGEIEAHLTELGIPFQRVSETAIQVVRQIGPQTVHVTIDTARTIRIVSAEGVKNLTLGDSAQTRLYFDPEWKERYDFDLALDEKTFALMNAAQAEMDDLPAPPPPASGEAPDLVTTQKVFPTVPAPEPITRPEAPPVSPPASTPLGAAPPRPSGQLPVQVLGFQKPSSQPLGMQRVPSSPTVPSHKPAQIAATMMEALKSVPEEEPPQSLAEISAMIPKRADLPSVITDLTEEPAQDEPHPRAAKAREDEAPLPVPAVILPSTPDGKPPVLAPAGEASTPPAWRSTPAPPPLGSEPPRPSGRIHIGNGVSRDVIDLPIAARAEPAAEPGEGDDTQPVEELPDLEPTAETSSADDSSVVVTEPSMAPFRPSAERRPPPASEPARPPPPVLHRFDEPASVEDTSRNPIAPRAMAARARRSGLVWAALLGLALGGIGGLQFAAPGPIAALFPPTAASEVRAGAQAARHGDVDGALAHFRRASELDPKWAPAWRNLGVTYALKGDQVQSAQAYRKYLELEQDPEQAGQVRSLLGEK